MVEPCSVVADPQFHCVPNRSEGDFEPGSTRMADHISNAFLRTAIERGFHTVIRLHTQVLDLNYGLCKTGFRAKFRQQPAKCLCCRQSLPVRWMQLVGNGAYFAESRFCEQVQPLQRLPGRWWHG
ncbi:MAG: hypothetical protein QOJ99_1213 [Bryobacterales bacterium]|nr:hypothetical protein [Bryobacterales bacterium]